MKNSAFILLATLFFIAGCAKDSITNYDAPDFAVDYREPAKVTICHLNDEGEFNAIDVSQNAVAAHLAHGDYLPDADGDGYTSIGACTGSGDDCDDDNPEINPGAGNCSDCENSCFDPGILFEAIWFAVGYYDTGENDCIGSGGEDIIIFGVVEDFQFVFYVGNSIFGSPAIAFEISYDGGSEFCVVVGEEMTEELFNCTLAAFRAAIASNPDLPNLCNEEGLTEGSSDSDTSAKSLNHVSDMLKAFGKNVTARSLSAKPSDEGHFLEEMKKSFILDLHQKKDH